HIAQRHPDLLPEHRERIGTTLRDPNQVRRSQRFSATRLFSRWFSDVKGGKHVVVVVVSSSDGGRHWIITVYITRKLAEGEVEWARSLASSTIATQTFCISTNARLILIKNRRSWGRGHRAAQSQYGRGGEP